MSKMKELEEKIKQLESINRMLKQEKQKLQKQIKLLGKLEGDLRTTQKQAKFNLGI